MTNSPITLELFIAELQALHSWPRHAAEAFGNATVHWELPRESWVRIAGEWAREQDGELKIPTLAVESYSVSLLVNGIPGQLMRMDSAEAAQAFVDDVNQHITPDDFRPTVRWYVVKTSVVFPEEIS